MEWAAGGGVGGEGDCIEFAGSARCRSVKRWVSLGIGHLLDPSARDASHPSHLMAPTCALVNITSDLVNITGYVALVNIT